MAAPDNHSDDPKNANENILKPGSFQQGPSQLSLTLLIVVVIIVTAICSVYRNELFSVVREVSAKLLSKHPPRQTVQKVDNSNSASTGPSVSIIAPKAPNLETDKEPDDKLAAASGPPQPVPTTDFQPLSAFKDQQEDKVPSAQPGASNNSNVPVPEASVQKNQNLASLDADLQKKPTSPNANPDKKTGLIPATPETNKHASKGAKQSTKPNTAVESQAPGASKDKTGGDNGEVGIGATVYKSALSQEFQLPGSVRVKIDNYVGVYNKWALMVIMDNSAVMNRESKRWKPARIKLAKEFASALPAAIPPGSKISMKDFSCKEDPAKQKGPCPVHVVYSWSEYPFKGLEEKITNMVSGKVTNPCGAVIGSIKRDFIGTGSHVPRLLLITCGQAKCPSKETSRVLSHQSPGTKVTVDVLALGMPSKRHPTYSLLAKKSGGLFLPIETEAQLDAAMARYKKALRAPTYQRIEIRNDKATVSVPPDEDMALAPGTYTVILPKLKGIAESRRALPNVKIKSGHSTIIEVNPKKGKATIKIVDKQMPANKK
ncbi:MAG: hypothetical protein ACP5U1_12195 [Desulfomonilaceae bacterium]